jgi:hypothetical protein
MRPTLSLSSSQQQGDSMDHQEILSKVQAKANAAVKRVVTDLDTEHNRHDIFLGMSAAKMLAAGYKYVEQDPALPPGHDWLSMTLQNASALLNANGIRVKLIAMTVEEPCDDSSER